MADSLEEKVQEALRQRMSAIGRKGGRAKSERKKQASRNNVKKANAARLRRKLDGNA